MYIDVATLALLLALTALTALAALAYTLWVCPEYFSLADYLRACLEFDALRAKHALTHVPAPSYRSYRTAIEVRAFRLALPAPTPAPRRFCLPSASRMAPANDVSTLVQEAPTRVDRAPASPTASALVELPDLPAGADAVLDAMLQPSAQQTSKGPRERNTRALAIALTRLARTAPYARRAPGASGDTAAYRPARKPLAKRTCDPQTTTPTRKYALGG